MDKAYLFGHLATYFDDGDSNKITVEINNYDYKTLELLKNTIDPDISIKKSTRRTDSAYFEVDLEKYNYNEYDIKHYYKNTEYVKEFIRAYFEQAGTIDGILMKKTDFKCEIQTDNTDLLFKIGVFAHPIPYVLINNKIQFFSTNAIDFIGMLYADAGEYKMKSRVELFNHWLYNKTELPKCEIFRTCPEAIMPSKAKESDVGYDLSVIKEHKRLTSNCVLYDTGIKVKVDHGYYTEIVPRSSLSKSGYMLANSTGIIDRSYRGNLYVALVKVDPDALPIEFPFKCCQLIFRKQNYVELVESSTDFNGTARGSGGFGSSG